MSPRKVCTLDLASNSMGWGQNLKSIKIGEDTIHIVYELPFLHSFTPKGLPGGKGVWEKATLSNILVLARD